ncbi:oxidoreductase [Amycolatopsis sp. PS_44_ISF1]|uniref:oxidoreductase n=1 Tax=Amycolatopsis sp. PS_44_ISF1 TaxID=2974917 RepID=UPI0028DDFD01|nr:oxidoreductase [Amycolatopsis sp. PS_44_ISF1]MDT8912338.1 oxidoreductase [Amycolatopsis sp. PS_44_ISF1]
MVALSQPSSRSLAGRVAVVTGASSGIGAATAAALASFGAHVVYAVRDVDKGEADPGRRAAEAARPGCTEVRSLDLADLASVRAFAQTWTGPIDLLINNAGVSSSTRRHTRDGFELQMGTNHLGHFALTNLLLPRVRGRVVTLASQAERAARLDLDDLHHARGTYHGQRVYNATKLANLLFTAELQRRLTAAGSPVLAMAAHPGFVVSSMTAGSTGVLARLLLRLLAQAPEAGALPVLHAATADLPADSFTGPRHLLHMRGGAELIGRSKKARDPETAARLWELSEQLTRTTFPAAALTRPATNPAAAE